MIEDIVQSFIRHNYNGLLDLYQCTVDQNNDNFHIEIELDGLQDQHGAVSLDICAEFSRKFVVYFDQILGQEQSDDSLIKELNTENYSIGVCSAGANRKLRSLPADLERYSELPLEIKYHKTGPDQKNEILHATCLYQAGSHNSNTLEFITYQKKIKKKGKKKSPILHLTIAIEDLLEARLYLDV